MPEFILAWVSAVIDFIFVMDSVMSFFYGSLFFRSNDFTIRTCRTEIVSENRL